MKNLILVIFGAMICIAYGHADTLFRWTDKDGKVHYGDKPEQGAIKAVPKKFSAGAELSDEDLPYSVRKAKQDFPVSLYVSDNCADLCVQARAVLSKRGIPYSEKNVASKEDIEAFKSKTGGTGIPTLMIGKSVLRGFESGQWNNELDLVGYPKYPTYGIRPKQPTPAKSDAST